jgi:predicted tellurium resistance membrane protein TerC
MLVAGVALWFVIGVFTALAGIQTGPVVLTSMVLIAIAGIAAGSFLSVRYITRNAVMHPIVAAIILSLLFVSLTMHGDVGADRVLVPLGAAMAAAISAVISRSNGTPPNKSLARTREG